MLVTAVGALVFQAMQYAKQKDILLFVISIILLSLAGFMSFDTITKILERKKHG